MAKYKECTGLPLHYVRAPEWFFERMTKMARTLTEAMVQEHGKEEFVKRISDPLWFQALGAVLGTNWHSPGIATSIMGALSEAVNPISDALGIIICWGRGSLSRSTAFELLEYSARKGLDGESLVRDCRLAARIDNVALQDGYQIYLHSYVVSDTGNWSLIQQGMNGPAGKVRRYHWPSGHLKSFVEEPHTAIIGENTGPILNLTDRKASPTREGILKLTRESPVKMTDEIRLMALPGHHNVSFRWTDLKRLGTVLTTAHERRVTEFEDLILLEDLGPRTLRALTHVSEVIHGTPSAFEDPARVSVVHGGTDGGPFPFKVSACEEIYSSLKRALDHAKIGIHEKNRAVRTLVPVLRSTGENILPEREAPGFSRFIGGTVRGVQAGDIKKKRTVPSQKQLSLFSCE